MAQYNHTAIEKKWRANWKENPINVNDGKKEKYYCLDMFPYPSGSGLHVEPLSAVKGKICDPSYGMGCLRSSC